MKNTLTLLTLLSLIIIASCSKKSDNTNNNNINTPIYSTYPSLDSVYKLLSIKSKTATMLSDSGGIVEGNSGTQYVFPKSSFITATGDNVTGLVQVEVNEWLKKGDMIFAKMLPVTTANEPLFSAGELYVNVTQNGQPIYLKTGYSFRANIPLANKSDSSMSFFRGGNTADSSTNRVNWSIPAVPIGSIVYSGDTISIISDSLQYCNADRFLNSPAYQTFTVTISVSGKTISPGDVINTYTLYDNYKGVWPLTNLSNNAYGVNHVPDIPVHFVSCGLINGHFYGGVYGVTPRTKGVYPITLTEVDPAAFLAQINGLYP